MNENQPIACDLTVFPASVQEQMAATVLEMFQAVQKVQELSNGYAFQFANEPGRFMTLAHFVEHERQCCPFYSFALEIEPQGGPLWLRMTGDAQVKQFMETFWGDLPEAVSQQLMQTGPSPDLDEAIAQAAPLLADILEKAVPPPQDKK